MSIFLSDIYFTEYLIPNGFLLLSFYGQVMIRKTRLGILGVWFSYDSKKNLANHIKSLCILNTCIFIHMLYTSYLQVVDDQCSGLLRCKI